MHFIFLFPWSHWAHSQILENWVALKSFGAKFQNTFFCVLCFFLTNYRLERSLYIVERLNVKQRRSRLWAVSSESMLVAKVYYYRLCITKTYLYNFDPLKPHFYIVKLGFTGVYIIFLISAQTHRLGYSLEPPRRGGSNEYPQSMFRAEIWKISAFLSENFQFFGGEIFYIFE